MPNKNTFDIKPIAELASRYVPSLREQMTEDKVWLDPFANKNKLAILTNDLNPEYDTDYNMDALEFLKLYDYEVDGVLFDPPFSSRQVSESYKGVGKEVTSKDTSSAFWANLKKAIAKRVRVGGHVISCGWNSGGMGKSNGFEIVEILLVPHGGWHNDTIVTVERKVE